jgi:dTDP-4-amino-4,6-dideoxygalactose transaminase
MNSKKKYLNTTESVSEQILTLPMFPGLKKEDLDYICDSIKEFIDCA